MFIFGIAEKTEEIRRTKQYVSEKLAIYLSIPMVTSVLVVCILVWIAYAYRNEIRILWNTRLNPSSKGEDMLVKLLTKPRLIFHFHI